MRRTKLLWIGAALLASAGVAFADDQGDPNAPAGGEAPPPATTGTPTAGTPAPAAMGGDWAQLDTRPLVIPQGKFEVHAGVPIFAFRTVDPTTMMSSTSTAELLSIGASYGVADKIEIGADYAYELNPNFDLGTGELVLHGVYDALKNDKMELGVAALLGIGFGGETTETIGIGAWFRYHVAPKISIFTGQPAIPLVGSIALFPGLPNASQLAIGLNSNAPITLNIPVGVSLQATPQIFAYVATDIADLSISNSTTEVIFSDFIPLGVGAWYSANDKLDVGVQFLDDLKNAGDFYTVTFAGRYYVK